MFANCVQLVASICVQPSVFVKVASALRLRMTDPVPAGTGQALQHGGLQQLLLLAPVCCTGG
jgi:hypothetical protein